MLLVGAAISGNFFHRSQRQISPGRRTNRSPAIDAYTSKKPRPVIRDRPFMNKGPAAPAPSP
jgi:hypothetical protein